MRKFLPILLVFVLIGCTSNSIGTNGTEGSNPEVVSETNDIRDIMFEDIEIDDTIVLPKDTGGELSVQNFDLVGFTESAKSIDLGEESVLAFDPYNEILYTEIETHEDQAQYSYLVKVAITDVNTGEVLEVPLERGYNERSRVKITNDGIEFIAGVVSEVSVDLIKIGW